MDPIVYVYDIERPSVGAYVGVRRRVSRQDVFTRGGQLDCSGNKRQVVKTVSVA